MLEAQDAGGNTQEVGDTEFERNEEVPSNSPGDQVGLSACIAHQPSQRQHNFAVQGLHQRQVLMLCGRGAV